MRQQINLYQEILIDKKPPLHSRLILGLLVTSLVFILGTTALLIWRQGQMIEELAQLKNERVKVSAEVQSLKLQFPPKSKDPRVAQELERLRTELANRRPLLTYFDHFEAGMSRGFSPVIEGLARYPYRGIWLTELHLDALKRQVFLAGSATRSDLVPSYLHHLGDKKVLSGQTFASLKLVRLKETDRQVNFRLESEFGVADE